MGDDPGHPSRRCSNGTSIASTSSSASRAARVACVPSNRDARRVPAALRGRDAGLGVLEDECRPPRSGTERVEREQVALRIGLAASDVVVRDDGREELSEPGRGDDGNDLLARCTGDDRELRTARRRSGPRHASLGHRRPVRDRRAVAVDPFADEGGDAWVVGAEAQLGDRVLGESGQALVVLTLGDRPAVLGEELAVDPAEDGLVLGERAVEVEDDRADRHVTREITLLCDAALRTPAGPGGGAPARALEPLARASARSRGGNGRRPRRRGDRLRPRGCARVGARARGLALPRGHELPAAPLLRTADHRVPEVRDVGRLPGRPGGRSPVRPAGRRGRPRVRHLVGAGCRRRPRRARCACDPWCPSGRQHRRRRLRARDRGRDRVVHARGQAWARLRDPDRLSRDLDDRAGDPVRGLGGSAARRRRGAAQRAQSALRSSRGSRPSRPMRSCSRRCSSHRLPRSPPCARRACSSPPCSARSCCGSRSPAGASRAPRSSRAASPCWPCRTCPRDSPWDTSGSALDRGAQPELPSEDASHHDHSVR